MPVPITPPTLDQAPNRSLIATEVSAIASDNPNTTVECPSEKIEPHAHRLLPLLHQLPRHIVDRRDMVRIHRVTQPERVRQNAVPISTG